ncbi:TetR/AcrR family transcriptional regulator [Pannonibacter sp. Pt2-lr]
MTQAMGISRSSLYAAFGSKQDVLLAALRRYSATALETLKSIGDAPHAHRAEAVSAMLRALADPSGGKHGCLLVNCITELAPQNEEVAASAAGIWSGLRRSLPKRWMKTGRKLCGQGKGAGCARHRYADLAQVRPG